MTSSLRSRAAASTQDDWPDPARPGDGAPPAQRDVDEQPDRPNMVVAPLEDVDYSGNTIVDADQVPVHVAWSRVMADVQSISKADRRDDAGGRYNFRGVDRVVNAVGPALRRHGVLVLPTRIVSTEYGETRTAKGTVMQECKAIVEWTVFGPKGDSLPPLQSAGQATDTQDKATSKAISVAQRVLFLTSLQIPTQDPDVDRGHERGERPVPKATDYRDEILDPTTSPGRLKQMRTEIRQHGLAERLVQNENGDDEALLALRDRVAEQRYKAGQ